MKTLEDKSEAELLVEAGKALVGINTYLYQGPTTQSYDYVDDAIEALKNPYTAEKIDLYLQILEKYGLKEKIKELKTKYESLKKIAKG